MKRVAGGFLKEILLLNYLYSAISDLFSAYMGKEKKINTPVKALLNKENNFGKLGFKTKQPMEVIGNSELARVYFPHIFNFSGELCLMPGNRIHTIDLFAAEVMKFIVLTGVTRFPAKESFQDKINEGERL